MLRNKEEALGEMLYFDGEQLISNPIYNSVDDNSKSEEKVKLSAQELADLSKMAYERSNSKKPHFPDPKLAESEEDKTFKLNGNKYRVDKLIEDSPTGFGGAVLAKLDKQDKVTDIIIVNRGTEVTNWGIFKDVPTDLGMVFTGYNRQLNDAAELVRYVYNNKKYKDIPVTITGHSLGGTLAESEVLLYNTMNGGDVAKAVVFHPYFSKKVLNSVRKKAYELGYDNSIFDQTLKKTNKNSIIEYTIKGDTVSRMGDDNSYINTILKPMINPELFTIMDNNSIGKTILNTIIDTNPILQLMTDLFLSYGKDHLGQRIILEKPKGSLLSHSVENFVGENSTLNQLLNPIEGIQDLQDIISYLPKDKLTGMPKVDLTGAEVLTGGDKKLGDKNWLSEFIPGGDLVSKLRNELKGNSGGLGSFRGRHEEEGGINKGTGRELGGEGGSGLGNPFGGGLDRLPKESKRWLGKQGLDYDPTERIKKLFDKSQKATSPLVIDLSKEGNISTSSLKGREVYFDLDNNNFAERTGWIPKGFGLLVRDINGNGRIDNGSELFGNYTLLRNKKLSRNGFEALKDLDSNNDKVINKKDKHWVQLKVWEDKNQDGISQKGELKSLSKLGIKSIKLDYKDINKKDKSGNIHKQISQVNWKDGKASNIEDIWFETEPRLSIEKARLSDLKLGRKQIKELRMLPDIKGSGNMHSLRYKMGEDKELLKDVKNYINSVNKAERTRLLEQIIYRWSEVIKESKDSRGVYIEDARKLYTLEKLLAVKFKQEEYGNNPGPNASNILTGLFEQYSEYIKANLDIQSKYKDLFVLKEYRTLFGKKKYRYPQLKKQLLKLANKGEVDKIIDLNNTLRGLSIFLTDKDKQIKETISDVYKISNKHPLLRDYLNTRLIIGTGSSDSLIGTKGKDTLIGGSGDDYLAGGDGNDVYVFEKGFGKDTIYDESGEDKILFGKGILPRDIKYSRNLDSLIIENKNNKKDKLIIKNFFGLTKDGLGEGVIESIKFSNGKKISLNKILSRSKARSTNKDDSLYLSIKSDKFKDLRGNNTIYGLLGNDKITTGSGNDKLYGNEGNDILKAGKGNDYLVGGSGSDTYVFEKGFGNDVINNYDTSKKKKDTIKFVGISPKDIVLHRNSSNDLIITTKDGKNSIKVNDHFTSSNYAIDEIKFAGHLKKINKDKINSLVNKNKISHKHKKLLNSGNTYYKDIESKISKFVAQLEDNQFEREAKYFDKYPIIFTGKKESKLGTIEEKKPMTHFDKIVDNIISEIGKFKSEKISTNTYANNKISDEFNTHHLTIPSIFEHKV